MLMKWKRLSLLLSAFNWRTVLGISLSVANASPFQILDYETILSDIQDLAATYPHLVKVYSAQEKYGLPSPGKCSDDGSVDCQQWVMHITDHATLAEDPERPEVFFSGCLHGNERVGPSAVLEAAILMVTAAVCHTDASVVECKYGALKSSPDSVPWLARLALTRSTVFMPMTNAIGYFKNDRMENGLDPNRDFPYQQSPSKCMTTITARAVNEVWKEHVFQLAVTFHGGMVAMAYEWGSVNHPHSKSKAGKWEDISPDQDAQMTIAHGLSRFAGSFKSKGTTYKSYPIGSMNQLVYPVDGGMEDWAYAGSWDDRMVECTPATYGGYPAEKTRYNSATLRAFNMLVETSDMKTPLENSLGCRKGLLAADVNPDERGNGHVARNVRLALMVVDVVQPYVQWQSFSNGLGKNEAHWEEAERDADGSVELEWTVGGGFQVQSTQLVWGPWPEDADSMSLEEWESLVASIPSEHRSHEVSGATRWGNSDSKPFEPAIGTKFKAKVRPNGSVAPGNEFVFVAAVAAVDQDWAEKSETTSPDIPPQSHLTNARTLKTWRAENAGHTVRGRVLWLTKPLKVKVAQGKLASETVQEEASHEESASVNDTPQPEETNSVEGSSVGLEMIILACLGILLAVFGVYKIGMTARRRGVMAVARRALKLRTGERGSTAQGNINRTGAISGSLRSPDFGRRRMKEGIRVEVGTGDDERAPMLFDAQHEPA